MIRELDFKELEKAEQYFQAGTGIDPADVPSKYEEFVLPAREMVEKNCRVAISSEWCKIKTVSKDEDFLVVAPENDGSSEKTLVGEMPVKVFSGCKRVLCFVATLQHFDDIKSDDLMMDYFIDAWGNAYVESATSLISEEILKTAQACDARRTHVWCPGQHNFSLENQTPLFEILHSDRIGCTLTENLMMRPIKSSSGVIGIMEDEKAELIRPCDFCPHHDSCPNYKCSAI